MITWVDASAGSGKTYNLVQEIKKLILKKVHGESILCLSFSNAAANEMKDRLRAYSDKIRFYTVHSFCNTFYDDSQLINEIESENLIKRIINDVLQEQAWFDLIYLLLDEWASLLSHIIMIVKQDNIVTLNDLCDFVWNPIEFPDSVICDLNKGGNLELKLLNANSINSIEGSNDNNTNDDSYSDINDHGTSENSNDSSSNIADKYNRLDAHNSGVNSYDRVSKQNITPEHVFNIIMTKDGELRKKLYSKKWGMNHIQSREWLDNYFIQIKEKSDEYNEYQVNLKSNSIGQFINHIKLLYRAEKDKNKLVDFNDLIKNVNFADYNVLQKIIPIKYIFVDEAQDLSQGQWDVVLNLYKEIQSSNKCTLYIVGDEKQSIYSSNTFDGPLFTKMKRNLQNYAKTYGLQFEVKKLHASYRSSDDILHFVDTVMSYTNYPTKHISNVNFRGKVQCKLFDDNRVDSKIFTDMIKKIRDLVNEYYLFEQGKYVEFKDILILIKKRNNSTFRLLSEIQNAGIPINEHPFYIMYDCIVESLINIAKFALFKDSTALIAILKNGYFKWSYEDLEMLFCEQENIFNLNEDYCINLGNYSDMSDEFLAKVIELNKYIKRWVSYPKNIIPFFSQIVFNDNYGKYLMKLGYNSILAFWEIVNDFGEESWLEFFDYVRKSKKMVNHHNNGIRIKTVHSSKGLESPIVIIFDDSKYDNIQDVLYDSGKVIFPHKQSIKYQNALKKRKHISEYEYDRLLYVAITRSKEQLYIYTVKNKLSDIIFKAYAKESNIASQEINLGLELTKDYKKLS